MDSSPGILCSCLSCCSTDSAGYCLRTDFQGGFSGVHSSISFAEIFVLQVKDIGAPPKGHQHQDHADPVHDARDGVIVLQPSEIAKNVAPIVITRDVTACYTTQQNQLFGAGVIDVWCCVHETLAQPPETYPGGEGIPGFEQSGGCQTLTLDIALASA